MFLDDNEGCESDSSGVVGRVGKSVNGAYWYVRCCAEDATDCNPSEKITELSKNHLDLVILKSSHLVFSAIVSKQKTKKTSSHLNCFCNY